MKEIKPLKDRRTVCDLPVEELHALCLKHRTGCACWHCHSLYKRLKFTIRFSRKTGRFVQLERKYFMFVKARDMQSNNRFGIVQNIKRAQNISATVGTGRSQAKSVMRKFK